MLGGNIVFLKSDRAGQSRGREAGLGRKCGLHDSRGVSYMGCPAKADLGILPVTLYSHCGPSGPKQSLASSSFFKLLY